MVRFGKTQHIHFVGIGGIGMSGIAELLLNLGYRVSGSDLKGSRVTARLRQMGGIVCEGHDAAHIQGADVVVYSSAVRDDNPELAEARRQCVPVIPRAEMLAELMRLKFGIAIAGAHGKTTTTSMVASILMSGRLDPTVVIGGRLDIWGGANAKLGQGDVLVAEADESDGSFLTLSPAVCVITNIDQEHMDHYGTMDLLQEAFVQFANKVPFYGAAIVCLDNEGIQGILPNLKKRFVTYGLSAQADIRARQLEREAFGTEFELVCREQNLGPMRVALPGEHNVLNALAAAAVGLELGLGMEVIREGLGSLGGLGRRFQRQGEKNGILVFDDYGHHPTEIVATLKTAKECWPDRRLIVAFQPHRFSRTQDLYERFTRSFNEADVLVVAPVYAASETPIPGVDQHWLAQGVRAHGHKDVRACEDMAEVLAALRQTARPGDVILTLGAGDIHLTGEAFLAES